MVETVGKDPRDQEDLQDQKVSVQRYYTFFKMAENTLLFCLIINWPLLPRSHLQNSKEYLA